MRVAFAGTPPFAAQALEAIAAAGHVIPLVLTQPDRPAGRGLRLTPSAVAHAAARLALPLAKPPTLRHDEPQRILRDAGVDVMVVAAYGLLLPPAVLSLPPHGCVNIHASLLPRWRGAAPIQRAILAGDERTGISIMRMDEGLDTGPVLLQEAIAMGAHDTGGSLTDALASLGARLIVAALRELEALHAVPQDTALATHAPKIAKSEALIDWSHSAEAIERRVRAFNPWPGAETRFAGDALKIWKAAPASGSGAPGEIIDCSSKQVVVACGKGALTLERVQRAGSKPVAATDFARGVHLAKGAFLGVGAAVN